MSKESPSLEKLQEFLGYQFQDISLLEKALSHISHAIETKNIDNHYQRLEFLGDALLNFVLAEHLFLIYEKEREGHLARARAALAQRKFLANLARELNVADFIRYGDTEANPEGFNSDSILEDVLEAIIGAIYLDCDFYKSKEVILNWYGDIREPLSDALTKDNPKGRLQEHFQQQGNNPIEYVLISEDGPDHKKIFTTQVQVEGKVLGEGQGRSKKEAEEAAALKALATITLSQ